VGKIALADITLVEDPNEEDRMEDPETASPCSSDGGGGITASADAAKKAADEAEANAGSVDFKLLVDDVKTGEQVTVG
jgi:hypothetical protein